MAIGGKRRMDFLVNSPLFPNSVFPGKQTDKKKKA
jgi:hypothetical protein